MNRNKFQEAQIIESEISNLNYRIEQFEGMKKKKTMGIICGADSQKGLHNLSHCDATELDLMNKEFSKVFDKLIKSDRVKISELEKRFNKI